MLNEKNVVDIIIFSGQSNMQGQTEGPAQNYPNLVGLEYKMLTDQIVKLMHPVGEDVFSSQTCQIPDEALLLGSWQKSGSLVPSFVKAYFEQTGRQVLAVPAAKGATKVMQWLPSDTSGRFNTLIAKINGAKLALKKSGKTIGKTYFVWLQGESDAVDKTPKKLYKKQIIQLNKLLKKQAKINKFMIIRVGVFSNEHKYDMQIIKAQEELAKKRDFVMLTRITSRLVADSANITPDAPGHYNNQAMQVIGQIAGTNAAKFSQKIKFKLEDEPLKQIKK